MRSSLPFFSLIFSLACGGAATSTPETSAGSENPEVVPVADNGMSVVPAPNNGTSVVDPAPNCPPLEGPVVYQVATHPISEGEDAAYQVMHELRENGATLVEGVAGCISPEELADIVARVEAAPRQVSEEQEMCDAEPDVVARITLGESVLEGTVPCGSMPSFDPETEQLTNEIGRLLSGQH